MKTLLSILFALCAIAACSPKAEAPASPKLAQTCDALCKKRGSCDPKFDVTACNQRCTTSEAVRKLEGYRGDAGDKILECASKQCGEIDTVLHTCAQEVASTFPPSDKAKALCAKIEPQFRDCNIKLQTPCLTSLTLLDPADLGKFDECVDRQCRNGRVCYEEAEHQVLMKRSGQR